MSFRGNVNSSTKKGGKILHIYNFPFKELCLMI